VSGGAGSPGRTIDPAIASGYTYTIASGETNFAGVRIPAPLPGGDATFEIEFAGFSDTITAGVAYNFTALAPTGVDTFTIRGIDPGEALDPDDPFAFATELFWVDEFSGRVTMTPIVEEIYQRGDADHDGDVDRTDVNIIVAARNTSASGPDDTRDVDGDGRITVLDARKAVIACTRPGCAVN
jgi:hypothetical protein